MSPTELLFLFVVLRIVQYVVERQLARMNRAYYLDPKRQAEAKAALGMSDAELDKTLAYTEDKYRFGTVASAYSIVLLLVFLVAGGLGWLERTAGGAALAVGGGPILTGLFFFGLLGLLSMVSSLPLDWYRTFVLEERHGFNRQTPRGFWIDHLKGLLVGTVLGGLVLSVLLWIIQATGPAWWLFAWGAVSLFSVLTAWIYPTFLAPLFNKFTPVEGELRAAVDQLAEKVGFRTKGIFVMDASKRSSHGNAYFTGVFGEKRIVLFDTLVQSLSTREIIAVLAHELGHFKLHHVRWALVRGVLMTGFIFWLLSLAFPLESFYRSFGLIGVSGYGALVVFGLWFGIVDFFLSPLTHWISRKNEFAADAFARQAVGDSSELARALLKLRETSHAMPLSHPVYSSVYHSHPPLLERLAAMGYKPG